MADFTPDTHYVLSVRNQGLPWWKALSELVDNGFDAKADRVEITSKGRIVTVSDNGRGIPDVVKALRLGGHVATYGRGLGMYGVGLKDAWLSTGDKIEVETVCSGLRSKIAIDIRHDFDAQWRGPDPVITSCDDSSGTKITLHLRSGRNLPDAEVTKKLAFIFSPGITKGLQIIWRGAKSAKPLSASPMPLFTESVQDSFEVGGKPVSINIGILKQGERMPDGPFCFAYRHRIIEASSLGAKDKSCLQMGGMVTLGDSWVFTKNKDAIAECADELEDAIHSRIAHLLTKASQMAMDIESEAIKAELEDMMAYAIDSLKRERRNATGDATGTVHRVDSGRRRRKASQVHEEIAGSVEGPVQSRKRSGTKIDWFEGGSADQIGKYESRTNKVLLNITHPFVQGIKNPINTQALFAVAFAIFTDWICTHKEEDQKTLFEVADFSSAYSRLMKPRKVSNAKT